jgi:hypothetical protein
MKTYKPMIRPVVTYWSETWTLTAKDKNNLRILERQILRKISCPANTDNVWRIQNNMEIDYLIEGADILRFIKAHGIKWLGHIQRMDWARPTGKLRDWKAMGTRPVGKPRPNWEATRLETYGNQTSWKTKTTMLRRCHGRSRKAESQKLERGS